MGAVKGRVDFTVTDNPSDPEAVAVILTAWVDNKIVAQVIDVFDDTIERVEAALKTDLAEALCWVAEQFSMAAVDGDLSRIEWMTRPVDPR